MNDTKQTPVQKSECFVYLRRSQDRDDRQALSIEKQDRQVRAIVKDNNFIPIQLPPEDKTAKVPGRPIFNDMIMRIENGEARHIVVWALSRLSRNSIDAGRVTYLLDRGLLLGIHTPTRSYRNTPDDKAFLAIELAFAKKNNDDLSVQVKEGFETKRTHGQYPGPAPLGYLNAIIRPGERNIVPDPEKAPKAIRLCEMASTGLYAERWLELAKETFTGVTNIGDVFEMANYEERRRLMSFLGSNWTLGNKKVALTPREPLSLLHSATRNPNWRARPDSNRRSSP